MTKNWKHIKTILDSDPLEIDGLNIWDYKWENTGTSIDIADPLYAKPYTFPVFIISDNKRQIKFAAGEFSNCVWGIYMEQS